MSLMFPMQSPFVLPEASGGRPFGPNRPCSGGWNGNATWRRRSSTLRGLVALGASLAMLSVSSAGEPAFELANPTLASGGGVVSCPEFKIAFTVGEAAVGTVSAGDWRLVTGFPATLPDPPPLPDSIFADGFEIIVVKSAAIATGGCTP